MVVPVLSNVRRCCYGAQSTAIGSVMVWCAIVSTKLVLGTPGLHYRCFFPRRNERSWNRYHRLGRSRDASSGTHDSLATVIWPAGRITVAVSEYRVPFRSRKFAATVICPAERNAEGPRGTFADGIGESRVYQAVRYRNAWVEIKYLPSKRQFRNRRE